MISCKKGGFLDVIPDERLQVPVTLEDYQQMLDNYSIVNYTGNLVEISSDDSYLRDVDAWQARPVYQRNAYIWKPDIFEGNVGINDWDVPYKQVLLANITLQGLERLTLNSDQQDLLNHLRGRANFIRGMAFFNLAQAFTLPYAEETANSLMGIPLRIDPTVTTTIQRASLKATYSQVLNDLKEAARLLPPQPQSSGLYRPCGATAYAALARVTLAMRDYDKALEYSQQSLSLYSTLLDYNGVTALSGRGNVETLYLSEMAPGDPYFAALPTTTLFIDSGLVASYSSSDLRKGLYFRESGNQYRRRGSYSGTTSPFAGLATDETWLIKAECLARQGDVSGSLIALNHLLENRIEQSAFQPLITADSDTALAWILTERRKELVFRGLRWQDLRRLNLEGKGLTIERHLDGQIFSLLPNSPLYALPIPPDEIQLSGIPQNPRQ